MNRQSLIALAAVVLMAAFGAYALSSTGKRNESPVVAQPTKPPALTPEEAKSVISVQVLPEDKTLKSEEPPPPNFDAPAPVYKDWPSTYFPTDPIRPTHERK